LKVYETKKNERVLSVRRWDVFTTEKPEAYRLTCVVLVVPALVTLARYEKNQANNVGVIMSLANRP